MHIPGSYEASPDRPLATVLRRLLAARETAESVLSVVEDVAFDRVHGIEARSIVPWDEVGDVVGGRPDTSRSYVPTRGRHLDRLFAALDLPPGLGMVDIGAGKGLVLLKAARWPFARIVGVENSEQLVGIAEANVARYRRRTGRVGSIEMVHADAAAWEVPPNIHLVYLYNPFEEAILEQVMQRIHRSAAAHPRPMWVVMNHPQDSGLIVGAGVFRQTGQVRYGSGNFWTYQNAESVAQAPLCGPRSLAG